MLECPNCHRHTLSRWSDKATCPACGQSAKISKLLRALLLAPPPTITGMVLSRYWDDPPLANWLALAIISTASVTGFVLTFAIPRYKAKR